MNSEQRFSLRILVLDDELFALSGVLRNALEEFLQEGDIFPNLSLLENESEVITLLGLWKGPLDISFVCNRGRETDASTVMTRLEQGDFEGTYDLVLVDDRWDDKDTAGIEFLLSGVVGHIDGISEELPVISLFTRHLDKTRLKRFYNDLPVSTDDWDRVLPRDKTDHLQIIDLLQRTCAIKHMVEKLIREQEEKIKIQKDLENERLHRRKYGIPSVALPDKLPEIPREIIGTSEEMKVVYYQILRYSKFSSVPVHLYGETGVGKDLIAEAIHFLSDRKKGPFIPINCVRYNMGDPGIVIGELFGRKRRHLNAYDSGETGAIREAENGTLFLDEVHRLPPQAQGLLLRFLESGEYRPLGGVNSQANVRIISASSERLARLADEERFDPHLIARLNAENPIEIPPLRERSEDIPELVAHFLVKYCLEYNIEPIKWIPDDVMIALVQHSWPLNVRGLETFIKNILIRNYASNGKIESACLDLLNTNDDSLQEDDVQEYLRSQFSLEEMSKAELHLNRFEEACYKSELINMTRIKQRALAKAMNIKHPAISEKCKKYGQAMIALLEKRPRRWQMLRTKTDIVSWCNNSSS